VTFHSPLTVQSYARQLNILTNRTTALGVYLVFIGSSPIGWLNPEKTRMSLNVNVSPKKKNDKQFYFKHILLFNRKKIGTT